MKPVDFERCASEGDGYGAEDHFTDGFTVLGGSTVLLEGRFDIKYTVGGLQQSIHFTLYGFPSQYSTWFLSSFNGDGLLTLSAMC